MTYLDTRDLAAELEELRARHDDPDNTEPLDSDEQERMEQLLTLESAGIPDWEYGATLIPEEDFEDYARELAEDIGAIPCSCGWPVSYIDWEAAADALRPDYMEVKLDGRTYLVRA